MKVKDLQVELEKFDPELTVLVSSDEELNQLFEEFQVAELVNRGDKEKVEVVIYGLHGGEIDG